MPAEIRYFRSPLRPGVHITEDGEMSLCGLDTREAKWVAAHVAANLKHCQRCVNAQYRRRAWKKWGKKGDAP